VKVSVIEQSECTTIVLTGDDNTPQSIDVLKSAVESALARAAVASLVLDLTDLYYLGSEGVGVIAAAHKAFLEKGSRIVVRNPTRQVSRVFMVTRLDSFVEIKRDGPGGTTSAKS
jgi:anti-anti-sigma factor